MSFDATVELSNLNKNDTATNRSDKKEQDQFLTLEMGRITQFMEVEQKQMNHPSFPLSKVIEDLEKELDLDFSHNNYAARKKNLIPKKYISNAIET